MEKKANNKGVAMYCITCQGHHILSDQWTFGKCTECGEHKRVYVLRGANQLGLTPTKRSRIKITSKTKIIDNDGNEVDLTGGTVKFSVIGPTKTDGRFDYDPSQAPWGWTKTETKDGVITLLAGEDAARLTHTYYQRGTTTTGMDPVAIAIQIKLINEAMVKQREGLENLKLMYMDFIAIQKANDQYINKNNESTDKHEE